MNEWTNNFIAHLRFQLTFVLSFLVFFFIGSCSSMLWLSVRYQFLPEVEKQNIHFLPSLVPLVSRPSVSMESVETALRLYHVQVNRETVEIVIRKELDNSHRALTSITSSFFGPLFLVELGPHSFTSWSMLGATLVHEIEGHCRQKIHWNFWETELNQTLVVWAKFLPSKLFQGAENFLDQRMEQNIKERVQFEQAAYNLEIENQVRLGLSYEEILSISSTRERYYPRIREGQ